MTKCVYHPLSYFHMLHVSLDWMRWLMYPIKLKCDQLKFVRITKLSPQNYKWKRKRSRQTAPCHLHDVSIPARELTLFFRSWVASRLLRPVHTRGHDARCQARGVEFALFCSLLSVAGNEARCFGNVWQRAFWGSAAGQDALSNLLLFQWSLLSLSLRDMMQANLPHRKSVDWTRDNTLHFINGIN